MALEIERKFLLKNLPKIQWDTIYTITQIYCEENDQRYRIRDRRIILDGALVECKYFKTIKKKIEDGVYEEDETEITMEQFLSCLDFEKKRISKRRHIKILNDGLKWEVDDFGKLVIAEIELPEKNHPIEITDYIQNVLICEVTGKEEFSNYNLAESI